MPRLAASPAGSEEAAAAIELIGVAKAFDRRTVVGPLDLSIARGEFVAVLGTSGCGKTTTLKMINGLIHPDSGIVSLAAMDGLRTWTARRRHIGYVFQEVGLFPHLSIAQNIAAGPTLAGWDRRRIAERVAELLDLLGLPANVSHRLPTELSGGQRQRVGLARALAVEPRIMLMDEPFGALDPLTRDRIASDFRALHDRLGLTSIMITHDVLEALLVADRILVMDMGEVIADSTPATLLRGHRDPRVGSLIQMPQRQAERLNRLAANRRRVGEVE